MRLPICLAFICGIALSSTARAQDMRQKIQEEIRLQHERAHELQTIAQADEKMAQDLNNEAQGLEEHAQRLDQRAREFRAMAGANAYNPNQAQTLSRFADELDNYARSDRANVGFRRRVANDMSNSAHGAYDAARQHEEHANRMQAFLNQMNGPPGGNPWQ
jgi:hypothetical protein